MTDLQKVATVDEIPPGSVKAVEVDGERIAICNIDGALYAVSDICTHAHAHLSEGEFQGNELTCPLHGARFDVKTGKALCLPAVKPLATYTLEIKDGEVYIKA